MTNTDNEQPEIDPKHDMLTTCNIPFDTTTGDAVELTVSEMILEGRHYGDQRITIMINGIMYEGYVPVRKIQALCRVTGT